MHKKKIFFKRKKALQINIQHISKIYNRNNIVKIIWNYLGYDECSMIVWVTFISYENFNNFKGWNVLIGLKFNLN